MNEFITRKVKKNEIMIILSQLLFHYVRRSFILFLGQFFFHKFNQRLSIGAFGRREKDIIAFTTANNILKKWGI